MLLGMPGYGSVAVDHAVSHTLCYPKVWAALLKISVDVKWTPWEHFTDRGKNGFNKFHSNSGSKPKIICRKMKKAEVEKRLALTVWQRSQKHLRCNKTHLPQPSQSPELNIFVNLWTDCKKAARSRRSITLTEQKESATMPQTRTGSLLVTKSICELWSLLRALTMLTVLCLVLIMHRAETLGPFL